LFKWKKKNQTYISINNYLPEISQTAPIKANVFSSEYDWNTRKSVLSSNPDLCLKCIIKEIYIYMCISPCLNKHKSVLSVLDATISQLILLYGKHDA